MVFLKMKLHELLCICSILLLHIIVYGFQTSLAYSSWGRTSNLQAIDFTLCEQEDKVILSITRSLLALIKKFAHA